MQVIPDFPKRWKPGQNRGFRSFDFDTFEILDKRKSEKRHQPTLENIKDIDKVTQLIRQGIQQNN